VNSTVNVTSLQNLAYYDKFPSALKGSALWFFTGVPGFPEREIKEGKNKCRSIKNGGYFRERRDRIQQQ
jgi:hypothetical protein